jgi:hypothetical protein
MSRPMRKDLPVMAGDWLASLELLFGTALGYPALHRV